LQALSFNFLLFSQKFPVSLETGNFLVPQYRYRAGDLDVRRGAERTEKFLLILFLSRKRMQTVKKEESTSLYRGELEGAKPASNEIKRPEKPAQQAFGERSENFCAAKVTAFFLRSGKSYGLSRPQK